MSLGTMLFNLIIGPLKMLFELIFSLLNRFVSPGLSIAGLSLCMNLLVLPLYLRADAIQDEERRTEARLAPGVAHIRKAFQGDERFMILQTYYRQNHYHQLHALKGALPLLLEVPFFIAAYQYLSGLDLLQNAAFGPIRNLGAPDALLAIGGWHLNVLPVLMTVINLISSEIYMHGTPWKNKIQLYAMALIFLVLLYDSPAGLTLYWTLNNLFSLVKNLLAKSGIKLPERRGKGLAYLSRKPNPGLFFLTGIFAAILTGVLIPSAVIASSPSEFLDGGAILHPFWYILNSLLLATGTFVLWLGVYYLLGNPRMKKRMELLLWVAAGCMMLNYTAFHAELGVLSSTLQFEDIPEFTWPQKWMNLGVTAAVGAFLCFVYLRGEKLARGVSLAAVLTVATMSAMNCVQAAPDIRTAMVALESGDQDEISIPLTKSGKNVVVLMLDRAISSFVPAILAEKPEVAAQFDGFTWYSNALSHGAFTNFGSPGLFGGYEYTPWEMNQRKDKLLQEKHNEALLMMPTLFGQQDYQVTVIDPPYAGTYAFITDLSIYEGMKNVRAYRAEGYLGYSRSAEGEQRLRFRNFFSYALCESSPWLIYGTLYNCGYYNETNAILSLQVREGVSVSTGVDADFLANYDVLANLTEITRVQDDGQNTLLLMDNNLPHNPQLLQTPDYEPMFHVDNRDYDAGHEDRFSAGPISLRMTDGTLMAHYHVNMASLIQVGKWLDYLRENGVYDNTRIILVSDHGRGLPTMAEYTLEENKTLFFFNPLLLVKDFDSHGAVKTDGTFMTNADVPGLATDGLLEHPANPFSGKEIDGQRAKEEPQKVTTSFDWDTGSNQGYTFTPGRWYEVQDEVMNPECWTYLGEY